MISLTRSLFRSRFLILTTFLLTTSCVFVILALKPKRYESHTSFLVRNERADLVVSTDAQQNFVQHGGISEEDINSEVELLGSSELLQGVVESCGLDSEFSNRSGQNKPAAIEKAMRKLSKNLLITPVRKSALITVACVSEDRNQSVRVLNELTKEYLAKHVDLHTAGTAASFFRQKSFLIAEQLRDKKQQRVLALQANGYSQLAEQKDLSLQQMLDIKRSLNDTNATLAETTSRLRQTESQVPDNNPRLITQSRVAANQYSVERLNTMLAEIRNKRTELAVKFRPGDVLLMQADREIADTEASLQAAKSISSEDKTTDINPVWLALKSEISRLQEQQLGLVSRKVELSNQLERQRSDIGKMEQASIDVETMDREIKELETSLDLYRNKATSAGIAEDLDAAEISNVVVATPPIVPVLPAPSVFNYVTGLIFSLLLSVGVGLLSVLGSEKLYGSEEVERQAAVPVLTSFE